MMRTTIAACVLSLSVSILAGCASSGVVKTGPDMYMIANSEWGFTSGDYQKAKAIAEGDQYCASIGRQILVVSSKDNDVAFGKTPAAEVDFKCVPKDGSTSPK